MSRVNSIYHIVINTYQRKMTIPESYKRDLYMYIYGIIRNKGAHLYRMNGIGNHIHILVNIPASLSLSQFVQSIKQNSSIWLSSNPNFPEWEKWGKEYFADSKSVEHIDSIVSYILHQEEHHKVRGFDDELKSLYITAGFNWREDCLT